MSKRKGSVCGICGKSMEYNWWARCDGVCLSCSIKGRKTTMKDVATIKDKRAKK